MQLPNLNRISAVNPVHSLCKILQIKHLRTNTTSLIWHTKRGAQHVSASERNTGVVRSGSTPTISFDFCYVKGVPEGSDPKEIIAITSLIMTDSMTDCSHATPVRSKNQYQLMVQEILTFCQLMGHSPVTLRCDNGPVLVQVLRMTVIATLAMGLPTRASTPMAYSH